MSVFLRLRLWLRRPVMLRLFVVVPTTHGPQRIDTIEGIFKGFVGRGRDAHYLIAKPRHLEIETEASPLASEPAWIPRERVFYAQEVRS